MAVLVARLGLIIAALASVGKIAPAAAGSLFAGVSFPTTTLIDAGEALPAAYAAGDYHTLSSLTAAADHSGVTGGDAAYFAPTALDVGAHVPIVNVAKYMLGGSGLTASAYVRPHHRQSAGAAALKHVPTYTATAVHKAPLVASPSSYHSAAAAAFAPYRATGGVTATAAAGYGIRSNIGAGHGVQYAPTSNKPYDPAVHLNEPARAISPEYNALSGILANVGQVSLVDKNDPRRHASRPRHALDVVAGLTHDHFDY